MPGRRRSSSAARVPARTPDSRSRARSRCASRSCVYASVMADPEPPAFDAVAAAAELDELLSSSEPADASYTTSLETEIEELNALVAKKEAEVKAANDRADRA